MMYNTGLPYTEAEDDFIRKYYPDKHNMWMEVKMGRSGKAIRNRAEILGVRKSPEQHCRRWGK